MTANGLKLRREIVAVLLQCEMECAKVCRKGSSFELSVIPFAKARLSRMKHRALLLTSVGVEHG